MSASKAIFQYKQLLGTHTPHKHPSICGSHYVHYYQSSFVYGPIFVFFSSTILPQSVYIMRAAFLLDWNAYHLPLAWLVWPIYMYIHEQNWRWGLERGIISAAVCHFCHSLQFSGLWTQFKRHISHLNYSNLNLLNK